MFGFGKKKNEFQVAAMVSGNLKSIDKSIDDVFAQKMMGDGFFIEPTDNVIVSPVDGEVVMVFPTKHAIGIKDEKGNEYLIHVGIETVSLDGEGFECFVEMNQKVKKGEKLLTCDFASIKDKVKSTDVVLILTDQRTCSIIEEKSVIAGEENIIKINGGK
jgi:glucose-specific phosphotransferase system IIA component